ncbi:MAG: CubicO group peptidase (beta-lactamase class C family) [Porticoccaceae bacterium]|jgi:CubicO group peptidase (beta-lactamase class C family)|tara:strand:- start:1105 stop:2355 length:1251 start_codon:yes stop_codon:yes gene_type:complete
MQNIIYKTVIVLTILITGVIGPSISSAEESDRPTNLTLESFQFGPVNRWTFSHMREIIPTVNIPRDTNRFLVLNNSDDLVADFSVEFQGRKQSIDEIAVHQFIDGLLIIKDGEIVVENYYGHLTQDRPHLMNSVSKSIVGLVAGKLAAQGVIDLEKPVSHYVPALAKSGYGPDSLQTLLDMRDGSDYTETYADFTTTFRLQDCAIGWTDADYCPKNGPIGLYEFLPTVGREKSKLGTFSYRSGSTNVIGWVLEAVTKQPLAELISEHIWQPMGAEFDANITVDEGGFVLADHGISATLRDLGRMGLLVLNDGKAFGNEVIPSKFIQDIRGQQGDPKWPYPGLGGYKPYYRSFWWGEGNPGGDISGYGIHGQFVRVVPEAGLVITMYSTWPRADGNGETHGWETSAELMDMMIARFR